MGRRMNERCLTNVILTGIYRPLTLYALELGSSMKKSCSIRYQADWKILILNWNIAASFLILVSSAYPVESATVNMFNEQKLSYRKQIARQLRT